MLNNNIQQANRNRSGIILLMVLGVLGLMSVLAITFVSMSQLERAISSNYVAYVRAQLAAESGVEKAIAEVSKIIGSPSVEELDAMVCGPTEPVTTLLADILQPSYAVDLEGDGFIDPFSGSVGSSFSVNGDLYKLRVEDESAKYNLNDSPGLKMPIRMFRVIETLVELVFEGDSRLPLWATDIAIEIELAREQTGGRFSGIMEVRNALTQGPAPLMNIGEWQALASNITVSSWQDPNTLLPYPPFNRPVGEPGISESVMDQITNVAADDFDYTAPATIMVDRYGDDVYKMDMFQMRELQLEPRAPVHINAASEALITALFEGIQGYYIFDYGYLYDTGDFFQLASQRRHDTETPSQDDGFVLGYHAMYGWIYPPPFVPSYNRNYRPILYSNAQFDDATYDLNGVREMSSYALWWHGVLTDMTTNYHKQLAGGGLGALKKSVAVNRDLARILADLIYRRVHIEAVDVNNDGDTGDAFEAQNPFRTWQEFQGFIYAFFDYDALSSRVPVVWGPDPDISDYMRRSMADAILANFNPNSDLIDYNPNKTMYKFVDKGHLVNDFDLSDPDATQGYSTEFSFEATGSFSVQSLGQILGNDDEIISQATLHAYVELWRPWRITSQAQFLGQDSVVALDNIKDFDEFFFANTMGVLPTAGSRAGILGPNGETKGYTCTSFPEAIAWEYDEDANVYGGIDFQRLREAIYDGYIMPSTWQENFRINPMGLLFQASFNGKLEADHANYEPKAYYESTGSVSSSLIPEQANADRLMIPIAMQTSAMATDMSDTPVISSGSLRAQGAYSEAHKTLIYSSGPTRVRGTPRANGQAIPLAGSETLGNFGQDFGQKGSMFFWVKPNWMPENTGKQHSFFDISHSNLWSHSMRWRNASLYKYESHLNRLTPSASQSDFMNESIDGGRFSIYMHPSRNTKNQLEDFAPWQNLFNGPVSIPNSPAFLHDMTPAQSVVFNMFAEMGDYAFDTVFDTYAIGNNGPIPPDQWSYQYFMNHNYLFTETANHKHKSSDVGMYNLDGRRWNFIGVTWNMHNANRMLMQINDDKPNNGVVHENNGGRRAANAGEMPDISGLNYEHAVVPENKWRTNWWRNREPQLFAETSYRIDINDLLLGFGTTQILHFDQYKELTYENPMRFGAWARDNSNFVADATFDEITIFANPTGALDPSFLEDRYFYGRYYHESLAVAAYRTAALKPADLMKVSKNERLQLRSISWTSYIPNDSLDAMESIDLVNGHPNPLWEHDIIKSTWDPITVDIKVNDDWMYSTSDNDLKPGSTPYYDASGQEVTFPNGDGVYFSFEDTVRLKIYFNDETDVNFPVHEAPILDDITMMFGFSSPKVVSWRWEK